MVPRDCLESKLDGQTDSQSHYSAYLWVVHNFDTKSLNIVFIDSFILHIFTIKIDFAIFCIFL